MMGGECGEWVREEREEVFGVGFGGRFYKTRRCG